VILGLPELARLVDALSAFRARHPDYGPEQQPTICVDCEEIGIGRWTCYCRRDD